MRRIAIFLAVLALGASACGGQEEHGGGHTGSATSNGSASMDHRGSVPGSAADKSDAARKVVVVASDDLKFDPASIQVDAGEVITFVVRNEGKTVHEFVLGDEAYQQMHEGDMAQGGHMSSNMDNAVSVDPSDSAEITWRFDETGEVLYGCHEPGHYDGGMVGAVEVARL